LIVAPVKPHWGTEAYNIL